MAGVNQIAHALWFESPRRAALRAEVVPPPLPREIQVRAIHSLVSAGTEINLYRGEGNLPDVLLPTARGQIPFPLKFAYQTIGRVSEAGSDSNFVGGEPVFVAHPHQDLFNVDAAAPYVMKLPAGTDLLRAQFLNMFGIALHVLLQRPVRPGEVVAVSGLGLIGSFAAYLARLSAGRLVVIDPLASRRERAAWIGADAVVTPAEAASAINALSQGRGVDTFIETSGAPPALQTAIGNTAVLGTIAVAAWYGTRPVELLLSPEFHLRGQKIVSVHAFHLDEDKRWDGARRWNTSLEFLQRIDVETLISHRIPFTRAPEAYRLLDEHPGETLAVLLDH